MSLDDERTNWHHHEQLERGDDLPVTVERQAAQRIGAALFKYLDAHGTFTTQFRTEVGAKCVGHRGFLRRVFDELDADPHRIGQKDPIVLRQQANGNRLDDLDWALEEAAYHKNAYEAAVDMVDRITAHRLAEHDPDDRDADREDVRAKEQRQDEHASRDAPSVAS